MLKKAIDTIIEIPEDVKVKIEENVLKVKGSKGEIERKFNFPGIKIEISNNKILVSSTKSSRDFKKIINTFRSHIKNLIKGVNEPFIYKLKICYSHFPIKVTQEQDKLVISNFLGEKIPRKAKILPGVNVKIEPDVVVLEGLNKEDTAQSAANIEIATKIRNRDRRIFQDGLFLI